MLGPRSSVIIKSNVGSTYIKLLLWFDERQVGCRAEFEGERAAVAFAQTDGG